MAPSRESDHSWSLIATQGRRSEARARERLQELRAPGIGTAVVFTNPVNEDRNAAVMRTIRALRQ